MLGMLLLCMLPYLVMTMGMATKIMQLAFMWHQESPEPVGNKWGTARRMHVSIKYSTILRHLGYTKPFIATLTDSEGLQRLVHLTSKLGGNQTSSALVVQYQFDLQGPCFLPEMHH